MIKLRNYQDFSLSFFLSCRFFLEFSNIAKKEGKGKSILRFISELIDGASLKGNILLLFFVYCIRLPMEERESSANTRKNSSFINTNAKFDNFKLKIYMCVFKIFRLD